MNTTESDPPAVESAPADQWAIVSLMGHCTFSGRITEEEKFGSKLGRCDIPQPDGSYVTRYFPGTSLYSLVICTEAAARARAGVGSIMPPGLLSLPPLDDDPNDDGDGTPY